MSKTASLADMFDKDEFDTFTRQIGNFHGKTMLDDFLKFHMGKVLDDLVQVFPFPSIWEVWNTWPRRKELYELRAKDAYTVKFDGEYISFSR